MKFPVQRSLAATALGLSLGLGLLLGGCAGSNQVGAPAASTLPAGTSYGVVESIEPQAASAPSGAGAVVGSVLGSALGYKIGGGAGQVAATTAGVAGGALAGSHVEQNRKQRKAGYKINVRLDNGSVGSITQDNIGDLSVGNRVRIDDGRLSRE